MLRLSLPTLAVSRDIVVCFLTAGPCMSFISMLPLFRVVYVLNFVCSTCCVLCVFTYCVCVHVACVLIYMLWDCSVINVASLCEKGRGE